MLAQSRRSQRKRGYLDSWPNRQCVPSLSDPSLLREPRAQVASAWVSHGGSQKCWDRDGGLGGGSQWLHQDRRKRVKGTKWKTDRELRINTERLAWTSDKKDAHTLQTEQLKPWPTGSLPLYGTD